MKKSVQKNSIFLLILSLILTIFFILGVPFIIIGATKKITFLLVIGIVMTVLGFYGSPISWVKFGDFCVEKSIFYSITLDKIDDINVISNNINKPKQNVLNYVNHLIEKRFLTGYQLEGDKIVPINKKEESPKLVVNKCPNCGSNLENQNGVLICKYCGIKFEQSDK